MIGEELMLEYKGIEIRAAEGVHEKCLEIIQKALPFQAKVLDIAAGAGAFSMRLNDAGYDVTANDIDVDGWAASNIPKYTVDLNKELDSSSLNAPYDLVVAIEIIEHLQNPIKFLMDCENLVKPGGYILLSTPNILDMYSRVKFLRRGSLFFFSPEHYFKSGHMTILPGWLLELFFDQIDLKVIQRSYGGKHYNWYWKNSFSDFLMVLLTKIFKPLMKTEDQDELDHLCVIYLLQRKTLEQSA
jgi:cyclopropane fatty-acyl-phospholipid synthase-like methyltransferase